MRNKARTCFDPMLEEEEGWIFREALRHDSKMAAI